MGCDHDHKFKSIVVRHICCVREVKWSFLESIANHNGEEVVSWSRQADINLTIFSKKLHAESGKELMISRKR